MYNEMMICVKLCNIDLILSELSGNYGVSSWFPFCIFHIKICICLTPFNKMKFENNRLQQNL